MFSQACVKNSVHGGCLADTPLNRLAETPLDRLGRHPPGQTRQTTSLGRHSRQTATAADGTHPTGIDLTNVQLNVFFFILTLNCMLNKYKDYNR